MDTDEKTKSVLVSGTFYPPLKVRHEVLKCKSERSFRWQFTPSFCQEWFGRIGAAGVNLVESL
jgi:hypothetical protein